MSYFRLFPTKNNTIFQYFDADNTPLTWSRSINTGANPIMEMMDGKGFSKLLFSFDIPDWLKDKLRNYSFVANLRLFDAGTLFNPPVNLKEVTLYSFEEDFAEGDGYSFLENKGKVGVSNFINNLDGQLWSNVTFTPVTTYHLNTINEDLTFGVNSTIEAFLGNNNTTPKFALNITTPVNDAKNVYTKFIHSKYTKTVFQPFIEFIISDEILDSRSFLTAAISSKVFLINQTRENFSGTLTAKITQEDGSTFNAVINNPNPGMHYINVAPSIPVNNLKDEFIKIEWFINNILQYKEFIKVESPNQILDNTKKDLKNLYFYVTTPYTHNIVFQGDLMPFDVVSQIRGLGNVVDKNYEYKVTSADGFEMVPWSPVSIYRDKMSFTLDTSYFYPEMQYEVFLRNRTQDWSRTSHLTYKFKVTQNASSHLRELNSSPYFSRDNFFSK